MAKNDQKVQFGSQNPDIYDNTTREIIQIMPDTLDNKLRDFEDGLKKKGSIFYDFGLIIAFVGTLVTVSQFKDFLNIPADVWQAVFVVFFILSILKFLYDAYATFMVKFIKREDILKQLLDETKKRK